MKLHILSDLHTEFASFSPPETGADVVVLAGDIGVGLGGLVRKATGEAIDRRLRVDPKWRETIYAGIFRRAS